MGMIAGGLGVLGGGLSLANNLFGGSGSASGVQLPPQQPFDLSSVTGQIPGAISNLGQYNFAGQNLPQFSGLVQNQVYNPYAPQYQGAAGMFGGAGTGNALDMMYNARNLGAGSTGVLNTAFDPQQALYNRTAHQVGEQSLAGLEKSGLATTPWGQGVYGNTMADFNIDWQNAQLGRQLSGLAGAGQGYGQAGNLGTQGWQSGILAGQAPWQAYGQIGGAQLGVLGQGANFGAMAGNQAQQGVGDWLSYMNAGNQANTIANQRGGLGLQQQGQGFNQNQQAGQGIGWGLSQMGNTGMGWGYGGYGAPGYYGGSPATNPNLRPY